MPTAANVPVEASVTKADDHTISYTTWVRYNAYGARLRVSKRALATPTPTPTPNPNPNWQSWATLKRIPITFKSGSVQGKSVEYPVLLDDKGEPNVEMGNAFLVWLKDQPELPKVDPLKFAQKFLTALSQHGAQETQHATD